MLGVTLSKNARARAVQLPAWNEALVAAPWDQQWSLRLQQIGVYETDMLEYEDILEGSKVNKEEKVGVLIERSEAKSPVSKRWGARLRKQPSIHGGTPRALRCGAVEAIETGRKSASG